MWWLTRKIKFQLHIKDNNLEEAAGEQTLTIVVEEEDEGRILTIKEIMVVTKNLTSIFICKKTNHVDEDYWFNKYTIHKKFGHIDKDCWYKTNDEQIFLKMQVHQKTYFILI